MKTLYNYIRDINISTTLIEGSLLDEIEDTLADGDEAPRVLIQKFLKENYKGNWTISEKPNKDGLYEVSSNAHIRVKNTKITSLTNDLFIWTSVKYDFNCSYCSELESLKGAPKEVGNNFYCSGCNLLTTLKGSPKEVINFYCSECTSLTTLEGATEIVKGNFSCTLCGKLESLKGAPKEVGNSFYCSCCKSLKTLESAPGIVRSNFYCYDCGKLFTKDDVKKVSKIYGNIYC